jgi:methyl-accepting chemotaxis protein
VLSLELSEGSGAQADAVGNVSRSIEAMNATIKGVEKNVESMSLAAEEDASSVLEVGSSIDEVAKNADSLSSAVEQTASSIHQINGSIQGVAKNVVGLSNIISGLTSSIGETDQSIKEVEKRAVDASKMSDIVTGSVAGEGVESVRKAVLGFIEVKEIVDTSGTVIMNLAAQAEDIGRIIGLIDGVNEQTSLLALNAAIIAAQAGEQGRGFSVVANEMRELSEKTADATKEISGLISSVQAESRNAVGVVEKGARMADEGVRLIHEVQSMLEGVRENTERSSDASRAIAGTAAEQATGIKHVMELAQKMSEMFQNIAAAATEQSVASGQIIETTEEMRGLASCVTTAAAEQSSTITRIGYASERTKEMAETILDATREEARGSERIVSNIQDILGITDSNANALKSLDRMVQMLSGRVGQLKEKIDRFKLAPDAGVPIQAEVEGANGAGHVAE